VGIDRAAGQPQLRPMLLNDSPLAPLPHPAAKTSTAALPHNVIAVLPLCFVIEWIVTAA
jgi:hypothetical protein